MGVGLYKEPRIDIGSFRGVRTLVTGGLGFIGSALARRLIHDQACVTVIDAMTPGQGGNRFNVDDIRERIEIVAGDVRDDDLMRHLVARHDVLFNLVGQTSHVDSMKNPHFDLEMNVAAQLSVLEACRAANPKIKLVLASTRQIYGRPEYLPVDEDHPLRPVDVNGINKLAGECHHQLYGRVYGIPVCVLRLTNTYGPAMRVEDARQTFLGAWVRALIEGEPIQVFGDGRQRRDFNYVEDCVDALLLAAAKDISVGKVYNLGGAEVVTLGTLAQMMCDLVPGGTHEIVPFPPERLAIDIGDYYADFSLVSRELGWYPKTSLGAGLRKTMDYYARHGALYWRAEGDSPRWS